MIYENCTGNDDAPVASDQLEYALCIIHTIFKAHVAFGGIH